MNTQILIYVILFSKATCNNWWELSIKCKQASQYVNPGKDAHQTFFFFFYVYLFHNKKRVPNGCQSWVISQKLLFFLLESQSKWKKNAPPFLPSPSSFIQRTEREKRKKREREREGERERESKKQTDWEFFFFFSRSNPTWQRAPSAGQRIQNKKYHFFCSSFYYYYYYYYYYFFSFELKSHWMYM